MGLVWNMNEAKSRGTELDMFVTFVFFINSWNFFQPDWYWRLVDILWAVDKSAAVTGSYALLVNTLCRNSRRVDEVIPRRGSQMPSAGSRPVGGRDWGTTSTEGESRVVLPTSGL